MRRLIVAVGLLLISVPVAALDADPLMGQQSRVVVEMPGTTSGAYIEDTANTVFHWRADDWNIVRFPQAFDNAVWQRTTGGTGVVPVITPDQAANPLGTANDADLITFNKGAGNTSTDQSRLFETLGVVNGSPTTFSIWMRTVSGTCTVQIGPFSSGAGIALANVTTTWQRFTSTITASSGGPTTAAVFGLRGANGTSDTCSLYAWGAQLVIGPTALPYQERSGSTLGGAGDNFVMNGTVPYVSTSSPFFPAGWTGSRRVGYGTFTDAIYFSYGTGNDFLDFTGDFTNCFVFATPPSGSVSSLFSNGTANVDGYTIVLNNSSQLVFSTQTAGSTSNLSVPTALTQGAWNLACVGRAAGTMLAKVNLGPTASVAAAVITPATSTVAVMGRRNAAGGPFLNVIAEAWFSTDTPSDALFTAISQRVLQMTAQQGLAFTNSGRAQAESYEVPAATLPTLFYTSGNVVPITPNGYSSWRSTTNYVLQSEDLTTTWVLGGTAARTADQYVAPDGRTTMDKIVGAAASDRVSQALTVPSSVGPFTGSAWVRADTGTSVESVVVDLGVAPAACTCTAYRTTTGLPVTCTAATVGNTCIAYATVGTDPVRLSATTTASVAITTPSIYLAPGQYGTTTGTGGFWGAQLEVQAYMTPYHPTTTATALRSADLIPLANPLAAFGVMPFCASATITPGYGRAWGGSGFPKPFSLGSDGAANSMRLFEFSGTGNLAVDVIDGATAQRRWTWAHGYAAGSTHTIMVCYVNDGTVAIYSDGVAVSAAAAGVGSGLLSAMPSTFYIGGSGSFVDGWARNVRICRGTVDQCLAIPSP